MAFGFLGFWRWRRRNNNPEALIDAVATDLKHKLVEARLQLLASDLARKELRNPSPEAEAAHEDISEGVRALEADLNRLESTREALIARAREAGARLAVERALMEAESEPAEAALDVLEQRISDSETEAEAVAEVRRLSNGSGEKL